MVTNLDSINLIQELKYLTKSFPQEAINIAKQNRHNITPSLLSLLKYAIDNHQSLDENYFGHLYALFLLAEFREQAAFPVIMQLAKLPEEHIESLLGDCLADDLQNIIASVYNGDLTSIQDLIEAPETYTWSRYAALKSLVVLVKEGVMERGMVIEYFRSLFDNPNFTADSLALTNLVSCAYRLYPQELYDKIECVYQHDLVDTWVIGLNDVKRSLELKQEDALDQNLFKYPHYGYIKDITTSMSGWLCFKDKSKNTKLPKDKSSKIGRNDPCSCGSGKKYKKCCLLTN